jgi:hypothetical protein
MVMLPRYYYATIGHPGFWFLLSLSKNARYFGR